LKGEVQSRTMENTIATGRSSKFHTFRKEFVPTNTNTVCLSPQGAHALVWMQTEAIDTLRCINKAK